MSILAETVERAKARYSDPEFTARLADVEKRVADLEAREVLRHRADRLKRTGIPEAVWGLLDAPQATDAFHATAEFLREAVESGRFLVLAGPAGRGKTVAACWGVWHRGGRYLMAQELVRLSTFDREIWEELAGVPLLALDDLGSERGNDEFDANLYEFLDRRHRRLRKTVICTNLTATDFRKRYAAGAMGRLHSRITSAGEWVNLPGADMRQGGK